jgi:phosphatidylinositol 4-kinase type 2
MALRKCFSQDADFKERMYAKQIAVMKGQAWNVVETLKLPDHGPLELTRRARVHVWDDLVDIPIAVPLRAPSAEMRRKNQHQHHWPKPVAEQEEMDITALSTPPQKPQIDLMMNSPPLDQAAENRFNLSRDSSSIDVRRPDDSQAAQSPATVQGITWGTSSPSAFPKGRPSHRPRMSYDSPRRSEPYMKHHRRSSLSGGGFMGDDDEGDLGYAANEDAEAKTKRVIVERLEQVKSKNPVFTWC